MRAKILCCSLATLVAACSPGSMVDVEPPSDIVNPAVVASASGAQQLYDHTVYQFSKTVAGQGTNGGSVFASRSPAYIIIAGIMTDELLRREGGGVNDFCGYDERNPLPGCTGDIYTVYNIPRTHAGQTREALATYASSLPKALTGHLYA